MDTSCVTDIDDKSYSEHGEDLVVAEYFTSKGVNTGEIKYIDIGASSPTFWNNTYYFYLRGSSGVLVEPLPYCYEQYAKERPRDIVVEGAAYWGEEKEGFVRKRGRHGGGSYVVLGTKPGPTYFPCPFYKIGDLLKTHFEVCPNYLSIDIEGGDFDVVSAINFEVYPIPVICGEFKAQVRKNRLPFLNDFMSGKGYSLIVQTESNFIYVR